MNGVGGQDMTAVQHHVVEDSGTGHENASNLTQASQEWCVWDPQWKLQLATNTPAQLAQTWGQYLTVINAANWGNCVDQ